MTEQTTALAPAQDAPLRKSLLNELAGAAGLDPQKYYGTIKALCGCDRASDEHFAALMMVAQGLQLNPILRELYLMPTQKGVQVVVPIDGYLSFLQRAEKSGLIESHEYEEGWWPDPRIAPKKGTDPTLRRGGRVTAKFRDKEKLVVHTEWFDEVYRDTSVWKGGQSRQLMHKTYRQFCRYRLGFSPMDADDAERIQGDAPRHVDAEVRDAVPAVRIEGLRAPKFAPPPPPLDPEPQREAVSEPQTPQPAGDVSPVAAVPAPEASPEFDAAESKRFDAEAAAEAKRASGELFS